MKIVNQVDDDQIKPHGMKKKYALDIVKSAFALLLLIFLTSFSNDSESNSNTNDTKESVSAFTPVISIQPAPTTTVCINETISLSVVATASGGGATLSYQWQRNGADLVDNATFSGVTFNTLDINSIQLSHAGDYRCLIWDSADLIGTPPTITTIAAVAVVTPVEGWIKTPYDLEVCKDATPQDIIFVGSNGTAPYTFTYEITSPLLPAPIPGTAVSSGNEAVMTPAIPTGIADYYTVTLIDVQDFDGYCTANNILAPSQAFISVLEAGIIPINLVDVNQTICEDEPITAISFEINGSPTNAYVDDLPNNVSSEYTPNPTPGNPGTLTISGTPNEFGVFNYTVITSGSTVGCNSTFDGILTINEKGKLSLLVPGTNDQSLCADTGTPISDITYTIGGAATGATVVFSPATPNGITYSVTGTTVTISGTPTEGGVFDFTVESFSGINSCTQAIEMGSISIQESEILLSSGTADQTICIDVPIEDIIFNITSIPVASPESLVLVGTLPAGVTFDSVSGLISGTPTEGGSFPYSIESSTGCAVPYTGEIIVNDAPPIILIENGLTEIDVCEGSEITLTATGVDTYEWYYIDSNDNTVQLATTNAYTYIPTENRTIYVLGKLNNGCENTTQIDILMKPAVFASITGVNSYEVCKDDPTQPTITFTGNAGNAPYTFTYLLDGISYTTASVVGSDSAVISIPTNVAGIIDIELTNVEDASGIAYCNAPLLFEPLTASVTVIDSSIYPQAGAEIYPTICEGEPLNSISFDIDAANAYAEGLPSGISSSFAGNVLTISGTPTVGGIFDYTITTSGQTVSCISTFSATITVVEKDKITPVSVPLVDQTVCSCINISPILFELGGGATGATVTGLPSGIAWSTNNSILTVSGVSCGAGGDYLYTITTQGACESATTSGTITIVAPDSIVLTSGSADELACVNTALNSPIQYQSNPGETLVLNGVLPAGLSFTTDLATGSAAIDGTPTTSGYFEYSVTSDNSCSDELEGSILVEDSAFINYIEGGLSQISCLGNPIEPLRYEVPEYIVDAEVTFTPSLPTGINYTTVNGALIISGTSNAVVPETSYQVAINSQCGVATSDFKLTVVVTPEIIFEGDSGSISQDVCQNNSIVPIRFKLNASGTSIDESLLPAFISVSYDSNTGIFELTGAPQSTGEFSFDIKTLGDSTCSAVENVTISNLYAAISVVLVSGSTHQTLCSFNEPIVDIIYDVSGSFPNTDIIDVVGLPQGIIITKTPTNTGILIALSGQPSSAGIYNYELVYNDCGTIKNGIIEVSSPMTVNGTVQPISCQGNDGEISVEIFGGIPFVGIDGQSYYNVVWNGPNGYRQNQTTITGLLPGDYILSGTDAVGCEIPTETFTIDPAEPISINLVSVSNGSCDEISGCSNFEYYGGTGIYTDFLLERSNTQSQGWDIISAQNNNYYNICGLETGLYRISVTDSNNCSSEPLLFTVEESDEFTIENIVLSQSFCNGGSGTVLVELNTTSTNLSFTYNGQPVASNDLGNGFYELQITPTTGSGVIAVTNDLGCTVSEEIAFDLVDPDFEITSLEFERFGYFEVNSDIKFTNLSFVDDSTYNPNDYSHVAWDFGDNSPLKTFFYPEDLIEDGNGESIKTVFHSYTNDGIYDVTLTLYNRAGCSKTVEETIIVGEGSSIMLPTAFSPNDDGTNDYFRPLFRGVTEIAMYIYDNWGNLVYDYTSTDATVIETDNQWGWDGIEPKNSESKNGNYRCYIVAKTLDEKTIEKTGRFLIIK